MHKIVSPHATAANGFTDGNPALGIEAPGLISKWQNGGRLDKVFYGVLT